jgi:hypothetical protein
MPFRTAEQFDAWFRRSPGGDPWGYDTAITQRRLDDSLQFIARHVGTDFGGTFIELGAFKGDFTERLARTFPKALIQASDFAPFAVELARAAVGAYPNVRLSCADMTTFEKPADLASPIAVLLMEAFYCLPEADRSPALARMASVLDHPDIFISCPIRGIDPYPSERDLIDKFSRLNYRMRGLQVLNYRKFGRAAVLNSVVPRLAFLPLIRRRLANQVIYRFASVADASSPQECAAPFKHTDHVSK